MQRWEGPLQLQVGQFGEGSGLLTGSGVGLDADKLFEPLLGHFEAFGLEFLSAFELE